MKFGMDEFPGGRIVIAALATRGFVNLVESVHVELTHETRKIIVFKVFRQDRLAEILNIANSK